MANYQAFSASVQGAAHVKKNIVMQDASGKFENEKVKLIAVSDGHGDSSCFRSDRGSRLIVEVGIEELKAFADEMDGKGETGGLQRSHGAHPERTGQAQNGRVTSRLPGNGNFPR